MERTHPATMGRQASASSFHVPMSSLRGLPGSCPPCAQPRCIFDAAPFSRVTLTTCGDLSPTNVRSIRGRPVSLTNILRGFTITGLYVERRELSKSRELLCSS